MRIGAGVPDGGVDAVDDPHQCVAPVREHPFERAPARSRLDLAGVGGADGADEVGEHDPGLEEIELAEVLHLLPVEVAPVDAGQQHVPVPEDPLIGHVVDRVERPRPRQPRPLRGEDLLVGGDEAGLPVVGMDDVARLLEAVGKFQDRAREEDEPLGVVGVVLGAAVERGTVEVGVVADQVDGRVGRAVLPGDQRLVDRGPLAPRPDRHVELPACRFDRQPARREDLAVGG